MKHGMIEIMDAYDRDRTVWVPRNELGVVGKVRPSSRCQKCHGTGLVYSGSDRPDEEEAECDCVIERRFELRMMAHEQWLRDNARPADSGKAQARRRIRR